jgi:RNA polymerase sigma-70 factor, ECF subfamily
MLAAVRGQGMEAPTSQITALLAAWRGGDREALDQLLPLIRPELHRLARRHLGHEAANHTMQASSLVQEAFLRLLPAANRGWRDRAHFFAAASRVMRHVLVDYAREKKRIKRGRGAVHVSIDEAVVLSPDQLEEVVALDLALERLAKADARKARVFEMRFFGGASVEETAEVLGVAPNTVIRDWNFARAWLRRELFDARTADSGTLRPS